MKRYPGSATVLVISDNRSLARLVRKAVGGRLDVLVRKWDVPDRELLRQSKPKLIVFDDAVVDKSERIWMLAQIKRFAPEANVLYVTAEHAPELERRVRAEGVTYYGPYDSGRLSAIAESSAQHLLASPKTTVCARPYTHCSPSKFGRS
jgi:hypothetical protein